MGLSAAEARAGLRMVAAVARAEGILTAGDRGILAEAREGAGLGGEGDAGDAPDGRGDVEAMAERITSPQGRGVVFAACVAMACADRAARPRERAVLDRIARLWAVPGGARDLTETILAEARITAGVAACDPVADRAPGDAEIAADILGTARTAAVLGLQPHPGFPFAAEVAVLGMQFRLCASAGRRGGRGMTRQEVLGLLEAIGLGAGARVAAVGLVKFLPGTGGRFAASAQYATTWALGQAARRDAECAGGAAPGDLRAVFAAARLEGGRGFAAREEEIAEMRRVHGDAILRWTEEYGSGHLTLRAYEVLLGGIRPPARPGGGPPGGLHPMAGPDACP